MQDHAVLRRGLDIVDAMLEKLEGGERIEIADVTSVLKFLRLFGDGYHQAMEETVLFPALLSAADHDSPVTQFVSEHSDERMLVAEIEDALMSRRGMDFVRSSRRLTTLLRNHFDKEDALLCDLTERLLSQKQEDAVVAEFASNRTPPERYANLSRLEKKYGVKTSARPVIPGPSIPRDAAAFRT
jgi:hemerythrin-like domain-containing protein